MFNNPSLELKENVKTDASQLEMFTAEWPQKKF